jgi:hypothetical protein
MTWPREFFTSTVNAEEPPLGIVSVAGVTAIDVGAGSLVTVTELDPSLPSLLAVMVAVPAATPSIDPLVLTVATS